MLKMKITIFGDSITNGFGMDELLKALDTVVSKSYNYNNKTFKYDNEIEND